MHIRRAATATLATLTLFAATSCASDDLADDGGDSGDKGAVTISGQSFPEATLVASMYEQLLADAGYDPTVKLVDTRDVYMKIFPGDVDIVPEYVGGIVDFLNTTENGADAEALTTSDAEESIEAAESLLDDKLITLLDPSEATDTNAFFVTKEYSESEGVTKLSDLKGKTITLAAAPDCEERVDCAKGLTDTYGVKIKEVLKLGFASDQTYQSVLDGESQLGLTSTTDGTLDSQGLVLLDDDQQIQTAQNLVPAVSSDFLADNEEVEDLLDELMGKLTTENLTELNGQVAVDRKKPEDVAKEFLESQGLL
ncbi:MAG: ABC transporter substrate-binding protein [Nocardioides sp.]|jgi:osmoprotectant transport system substrate-binding protein